jgi:hypothetical protein
MIVRSAVLTTTILAVCTACGVAGGLEVDHRLPPATTAAGAAAAAARAGDAPATGAPTTLTGATAASPSSTGPAKGEATTAAVAASIVVPASAIAYADGRLWGVEIEPSGPRLFTVDPGTNVAVSGPAVAGDVGAPGSVAVGAEGVWLAGSRRLIRVDPRSGRTVAAVAYPAGPGETVQATPLVADGSIFAAVERPGYPGTLIRADAASGSVAWTIAVGTAPTAITTYDGSVWLADAAAGVVRRIDERTGVIRGTTRLAPGSLPLQLTAFAGAIWAITAQTVVRIDPASGTVITVSDLPAGYEARTFAAGAGAVWAVLTRTETGVNVLQRLRPRSGAPSGEPVRLGYAGDIATGEGSIWVVEYTLGGVLELDPA